MYDLYFHGSHIFYHRKLIYKKKCTTKETETNFEKENGEEKLVFSISIIFYIQEDNDFYFYLALKKDEKWNKYLFHDFGSLIFKTDKSVYDVLNRICCIFKQKKIDKSIVDSCPTFYDSDNGHLLFLYNCQPYEVEGIKMANDKYKRDIFKFKVERNLFLLTSPSLQFCVNDEYGRNVVEYLLQEITKPFLINIIEHHRYLNKKDLKQLLVENVDEFFIPTWNRETNLACLDLDTLAEFFFLLHLTDDFFINKRNKKLCVSKKQFKNFFEILFYFQKISKIVKISGFSFEPYLDSWFYDIDDIDTDDSNSIVHANAVDFFVNQYYLLSEKFKNFLIFQLMFIK